MIVNSQLGVLGGFALYTALKEKATLVGRGRMESQFGLTEKLGSE